MYRFFLFSFFVTLRIVTVLLWKRRLMSPYPRPYPFLNAILTVTPIVQFPLFILPLPCSMPLYALSPRLLIINLST